MDDRFLRQLKKGVLEMLVLGLICDKPTYGYELLTLLGKQSDGLFRMKEGTLYPILYRLEDDGQIVSRWQQAETGRAAPKKIYQATDAGRAALSAQHTVWEQFRDSVDHLCTEVNQHGE